MDMNDSQPKMNDKRRGDKASMSAPSEAASLTEREHTSVRMTPFFLTSSSIDQWRSVVTCDTAASSQWEWKECRPLKRYFVCHMFLYMPKHCMLPKSVVSSASQC